MKLSLLILVVVSSYVILPGCWRENGEIDYVPGFTEMVQRGEIEQLNIGENVEGKLSSQNSGHPMRETSKCKSNSSCA